MEIPLYNNKVIIREGKIGLGIDCCCEEGGDPCSNPNKTQVGPSISYYTETQSVPSSSKTCDGMRANLQTIYIPEDLPSPICVHLYGTVDDDLAINGSIIEAGMWASWPFDLCNPAHQVDYYFSTSAKSFTIETVDNHLSNIGANITISFYA